MAGRKEPDAPKSLLRKKATFTLPPDAISSVDEHWRFHKTLASTLADSKSEYIADLIRRDAAKKKIPGGERTVVVVRS